MDENNQSNTPIDTEIMREPHEEISSPHQNGTSLVLGILIVVLVLVLGGLYVWGSQLVKNATPPPATIEERVNAEPETPRAQVDEIILNTVSTSDEISAIEADLESTNLDTFDNELIQIEAEMGATQPFNAGLQ